MINTVSIDEQHTHPIYKNYEIRYIPHKRIYDKENDKILDIDKNGKIKISYKISKNVNFDKFVNECETQVIEKKPIVKKPQNILVDVIS